MLNHHNNETAIKIWRLPFSCPVLILQHLWKRLHQIQSGSLTTLWNCTHLLAWINIRLSRCFHDPNCIGTIQLPLVIHVFTVVTSEHKREIFQPWCVFFNPPSQSHAIFLFLNVKANNTCIVSVWQNFYYSAHSPLIPGFCLPPEGQGMLRFFFFLF